MEDKEDEPSIEGCTDKILSTKSAETETQDEKGIYSYEKKQKKLIEELKKNLNLLIKFCKDKDTFLFI